MGDFAGVVESCFAGHLQGDERVRSEPGAPFFAFDRDGLSPETTESAAGPVPDDEGEPWPPWPSPCLHGTLMARMNASVSRGERLSTMGMTTFVTTGVTTF